MSFQELQGGEFASLFWLSQPLGLVACGLVFSRPRPAAARVIDTVPESPQPEYREAELSPQQRYEQLQLRAIQDAYSRPF
jgi:hypothetical protein